MEENLNIVIVGMGMIGSECARELLNRGMNIVGAVDSYDKIIGMDLGEHLNVSKLGVAIESDLDKVLKRTHPDLVILCTKTTLPDIEKDIKTCIANKVNVMTSSEHAYFWKLTNEEVGKEIDMLAKNAQVTVCAGGVQDVFWGIIPSSLTATCQEIYSIEGKTLAMVDDFGPGVMEEAFVGCTREEFEEKTEQVKNPPLSAFEISIYALADKLQLHLISKHSSFEPIIIDKDLYCRALNRNIPAGDLIGSIAKTELITEENIKISCSFISKLKEENDTAYSKWNIKGIPNITSTIDDMHGEVTTTTSVINRIPDIMKAKPGFITVNDLDVPYYKNKILNKYQEEEEII